MANSLESTPGFRFSKPISEKSAGISNQAPENFEAISSPPPIESTVDGLRGEIQELRGDVKWIQRVVLYGFLTLAGLMLTGFQIS